MNETISIQQTIFERQEQPSLFSKYKTKFGAFLKATFRKKEEAEVLFEKTPEERIGEALQTCRNLIQENKIEEAKTVYKDTVSYYNAISDDKMKQKLYSQVFDVYSVLSTK